MFRWTLINISVSGVGKQVRIQFRLGLLCGVQWIDICYCRCVAWKMICSPISCFYYFLFSGFLFNKPPFKAFRIVVLLLNSLVSCAEYFDFGSTKQFNIWDIKGSQFVNRVLFLLWNQKNCNCFFQIPWKTTKTRGGLLTEIP